MTPNTFLDNITCISPGLCDRARRGDRSYRAERMGLPA
jgi:hypothetical protein